MIEEVPIEAQIETCIEFLSLAPIVQSPKTASYTLKGVIQMLHEARTPQEKRPSAYISARAVEIAAERLGIPVKNVNVGISKRWLSPIDEKRNNAYFRAQIRERTFEEIIELVKTYEEPITV
ncbi:hypothetical protein RND59_15110 [Vibrio ruber]|uniref:hypothetical protein n=1 Tax=Vibrio ruber TaxID=184755 RepID=UPI0028935D81|nr:hypothetical protein [Vibrio ruber]WNJ95432.1 hypothetical protein RND59_15110 [Vibrio ruber]